MKRGLLLVSALLPAPVAGHAVLGMARNDYVTVAPGSLRLEIELTPGSAAAPAMARHIDLDGDRRMSLIEIERFSRAQFAQTRVSIDGKPAAWTLTGTALPNYRALASGNGKLTIRASAVRPEVPGSRSFRTAIGCDGDHMRCSVNAFVASGHGWSYRIVSQARSASGRTLDVAYVAARN
jgi:hypothetical protein